MDNSIAIFSFLFKEEWKVLKDAASLPPSYEVEMFSEVVELLTGLSVQPASLVIASIREKDDLIKLAAAIKKTKNGPRENIQKFVVVNFSGNKQLEQAVGKLGIMDVVDPLINQKALKFKLDFWMKALGAQVKKTNDQEPPIVKTKSRAVAAGKQEQGQRVLWQEPLKIEDDIWIIKAHSDCKVVLGKWIIKIIGPGPFVAQWTSVKLRSDLWRFTINPENRQDFLEGEETWYFQGEQKPEFVWKENAWMITGTQFELYIMKGGVQYSRLKALGKEKTLAITENSVVARMKQQAIIESFDKEVRVKTEQSANKQQTIEQEDKFQNLEGKGKTEIIQQKMLQGKIKKEEEFSDLQQDLESPAATFDDSSELDLKADPHYEKFYKGKNKNGPADNNEDIYARPEKIRKGQELSQDGDGIHEKFYKNHNPIENGVSSSREAAEKGQSEVVDEDLYGRKTAQERKKKSLDEEIRKEQEEKQSKRKSSSEQEHSALDVLEDLLGPAEKSKKDKDLFLDADSTYEKFYRKRPSGELEATGSEDEEEDAHEKTSSFNSNERKTPQGIEKFYKKRPSGEPGATESEDEDDVSSQETSSSNLKERKTAQKKRRDETGGEQGDEVGQRDHISGLEENQNAELFATGTLTVTLEFQSGSVSCPLEDFFDRLIIVRAREEWIEVTAEVGLDICFDYLGERTVIKSKGNVALIEPDSDGHRYITVGLNDVDPLAIDVLMKKIEVRQRNINLFMREVAGI